VIEPIILITALAVIWVAQSLFVYRQGRAFMRRIGELRREGRVAIGVGLNRLRIRNFLVVVADRNDRVVRVERLSGLTVFARPQPINRYAGLPLTELSDVVRNQGSPRHFQQAIDQAVAALLAPESAPDPELPLPADRGDLGEEGGVPISHTV